MEGGDNTTNPKATKSFRLSELSIKRLKELSEEAELTQTAYLEQLLKREAEKSRPQK
jgi:predicted DNA-binding protein